MALLLMAAVGLLWWHSARHCDALAIFGHGGKVGGFVFLEGEIWLVTSNIDMDEPWTARTVSTSSEKGEYLRELLTADRYTVSMPWTPVVASYGPFFLASYHRDAFGLPGKWCTTAGGPIWILLPLGVWPVCAWVVRRGRLWRRTRRGWCPGCGYDLHGVSADRCPECGQVHHAQKVLP